MCIPKHSTTSWAGVHVAGTSNPTNGTSADQDVARPGPVLAEKHKVGYDLDLLLPAVAYCRPCAEVHSRIYGSYPYAAGIRRALVLNLERTPT